MAGLSFAFRASGRTPLVFRWPLEAGVRGQLRNPRYRWTPPPPSPPVIAGVLRNPRYRIPPTPFLGELPPRNVRAGGSRLALGGITASPAATATAPWQPAHPFPVALTAAWTPALPQTGTATGPLTAARSQRRETGIPLAASRPEHHETRSGWTATPTGRHATTAVWRASRPVGNTVRLVTVRAWRRQTALTTPWAEAASRASCLHPACAEARLLAEWRGQRYPFRDSRVREGLSWPWPALPPLPPIPPRAVLRFHFHAPVFAPLAFHFGRAPAWVIPSLRSYRMMHAIEVVRLPDRTVIPVTALTLASAWDEWSWSLSATLAGANAVDLLRPIVTTPVEIEVTVDGNVWQFRLDQVSGSAQFGATSGQTQGRGRAALLGPGFALPANGYDTEAKTARQLAEQELTGTDWQLDWPETVPDWLVPEKTFRYSQKTPIEVIVQLVETAGARVSADPALSWLRVTPRYPAAPWTWSALQPDLLLPRAILTTLTWKPRPGQPWDAVFLGDGGSVLAKVKRTGLPGVSLPDNPTIDPLLCHLDACRARGLAILSDAIAGVDFTLALPLSSASGPSPLRAVGELARFADGGKTWAGLITGVTVQVGFGTVAQTLEVRAVEVAA